MRIKGSLNLLRIGKRAEKFGWGVRWKPWECGCHVTLPNGKQLFLHNEGFIPMVNSDKDKVLSGALSENAADTAAEVSEASAPVVKDLVGENTIVIEEVADSDPAFSSDEANPQSDTEGSLQGPMQSRLVNGKAYKDTNHMPSHPKGVSNENRTNSRTCQKH